METQALELCSSQSGQWQSNYEAGVWRARACRPSGLVPQLKRFVDGAALIRPLVVGDESATNLLVSGGVVGAAAVRLDRKRLYLEDAVVKKQRAHTVFAITSSSPDCAVAVTLEKRLRTTGAHTIRIAPRLPAADLLTQTRKVSKRLKDAILREMQALERAAAAGHEGLPEEITVVDGKLGVHLNEPAKAMWPLVGLVKRHRQMLLPPHLQRIVLDLPVATRSPAFLIESVVPSSAPTVSWYIKIADSAGYAMFGTVRVEVSQRFFESVPAHRRTEWADGLSSEIVALRADSPRYQRKDCSLQPIVMLEHRLHSWIGNPRRLSWSLARAVAPEPVQGELS